MKKVYKSIISVIAAAALIIVSTLCLFGCKSKGKVVEKDMVFKTNAMANDKYIGELSVWGLPIDLFADVTITLKKDGTARLALIPKYDIGAIITAANLDMSALTDMELEEYLNRYALGLFPGLTIRDLEFTVELLKKSLSLSFLGIDFNSDNVKHITDTLRDTGKIPADFTLPSELSMEYNANYYMEDVVSPYTGTHTAVYLYNREQKGDPYLIMTLSDCENKAGKKQLNMYIEFLKLTIIAVQS